MSREEAFMSVDRARELAERAHSGQLDRDGSRHIDHVARVAAGVATTPAAQRVAWLHDVLEDSDVTAAQLSDSLPADELAALGLLTHDDPDEPYEIYVARIIDAPGAAGDLARAVKESDMRDNLRRCARDRDPAVARYGCALARLWSRRVGD